MANLGSKNGEWGVHWFRRDLRVSGNEAFIENFRKHDGRVLGLFCFDSKFLSRDDFSHRRFGFFIETLKALKSELFGLGVELLVIDLLPLEAFSKIAEVVERKNMQLPNITFNRDYEPFARKRDDAVTGEMKRLGFKLETFRDHVLIEPHEIMKADGSAFQKYSAFAKQWKILLQSIGSDRIKAQSQHKLKKKSGRESFEKSALGKALSTVPQFDDSLDKFESENRKHFSGDLPPAGHLASLEQLKVFEKILPEYSTSRSIPSVQGSSEFSKFLKNGSLTLLQVVKYFGLHEKKLSSDEEKFLNELIWREYYFYILYHYPYVETGPFHKKYADLKWSGNKTHLKAWERGITGVPIVDAGMRELNTTGYINNRVRIIVGAFLAKDLYLNWQDGERYFMNQLIDGDLAANNGNWQWVASTGSESQPYFRIMNPWLQSERFDPDGDYIKKWIPELKSCPSADLHSESADRSSMGYPKPIVDHAKAKARAIEAFKNLK